VAWTEGRIGMNGGEQYREWETLPHCERQFSQQFSCTRTDQVRAHNFLTLACQHQFEETSGFLVGLCSIDLCIGQGNDTHSSVAVCGLWCTVKTHIDGRSLTEEELLGFCGQLFIGINTEIPPFLGNVVQSLIEHPEVVDELRAEPDLIPSAIEEMLRFYPPLPITGPRRATVDLELGGQHIREGQRVIPVMASANRDNAVFANPDHFDIRRQPNPHLSFVTGPHICPGAHLSRLMALRPHSHQPHAAHCSILLFHIGLVFVS
jgi:hypothetical protein